MRHIKLLNGSFYHFFNRGVERRAIFSDAADYQRFLSYLYLLNGDRKIRPSDLLAGNFREKIFEIDRGTPLVSVVAYCLMPGHFRGYATPLVKDGLSKFMQRVQTAYTMYFNKKYKRAGALFQGTFKARAVDTDLDERYLISHMHLNPISLVDPDWKELDLGELLRFRKDIAEYPYSSIKEFLSAKHLIIDEKKIRKKNLHMQTVDDHMRMWLRARNEWRGQIKIAPQNNRAFNTHANDRVLF